MTTRERKILWLRSEIGMQESGMVVTRLPRNPRPIGLSRKPVGRAVDPLTGKLVPNALAS